jgi:hypothetical protein
LTLLCFHKVLTSQRDSKVSAIFFIGGLLAGVAALFRFDLGLACTSFQLITLFGLALITANHKLSARNFCALLAGNALPMSIWLLALYFRGGWSGLVNYYLVTFDGIRDAVTWWSLPFPTFDWQAPISTQSTLLICFLLTIGTCVSAIASGLIHFRQDRGPRNRNLFLVGTGIMGLGLMPQAFYRPDIHHYLQVIPPSIIAACILMGICWDYLTSTANPLSLRVLTAAVCIAYLGIFCLCITMHRKGLAVDLEKFVSKPWTRFSDLRTISLEGIPHPVAALAVEIQRSTKPTDSVLIVAGGDGCVSPPQINFFSKRPVGGMFTSYWSGTLSGYRLRDLDAVRLNKPVMIAAPLDFEMEGPQNCFENLFPELYTFLKKEYTETVYSKYGWQLKRLKNWINGKTSPHSD